MAAAAAADSYSLHFLSSSVVPALFLSLTVSLSLYLFLSLSVSLSFCQFVQLQLQHLTISKSLLLAPDYLPLPRPQLDGRKTMVVQHPHLSYLIPHTSILHPLSSFHSHSSTAAPICLALARSVFGAAGKVSVNYENTRFS